MKYIAIWFQGVSSRNKFQQLVSTAIAYRSYRYCRVGRPELEESKRRRENFSREELLEGRRRRAEGEPAALNLYSALLRWWARPLWVEVVEGGVERSRRLDPDPRCQWAHLLSLFAGSDGTMCLFVRLDCLAVGRAVERRRPQAKYLVVVGPQPAPVCTIELPWSRSSWLGSPYDPRPSGSVTLDILELGC